MLRRSLADSTGHFWQPTEFKNAENPDFENLKHLHNPGHLLLTAPSMSKIFSLLTENSQPRNDNKRAFKIQQEQHTQNTILSEVRKR